MIPVPIIIAGGFLLIGTASFLIYRERVHRKLKNKSVILFGPPASGKTTIVNWLIYSKPTPKYHASASLDDVGKISDNGYTIAWSDMSGDETHLVNGKFEIEFTKHDAVFFVFNINEYSLNSKYQSNVNARLDALRLASEKHPMLKKVIILIGSHSDCYKKSKGINDDDELARVFQNEITHLLMQKDYYHFVLTHPLILANLTNKKDVTGILKKLIDELDKLKK